jgi:bifunctional non-homologous end joining protein LigD
MLASLGGAPLEDGHLAYEPKYDGIRAIVEVEPGGAAGSVRVFSRTGRDKAAQFPELVSALAQYGRGLKAGLVLDGEVVALDARGEPAGFQHLQGRIHLTGARDVRAAMGRVGVAFIAFDILRDGGQDLRGLSLAVRRARLERAFGDTGSGLLRLSEFVPADGRGLYQRALANGWEGLVAKHLDSRYRSGQRSPDWRKVKITLEQEFVVGGWTEPRGARGGFGALLLGIQAGGALEYVGHTGTGFTEAELRRVRALLAPLEADACPFRTVPATNERAHWARPVLVAEVRFAAWTADGKLRHPVYLGLRDDVAPDDVTRESPGRTPAAPAQPSSPPRSPEATALVVQIVGLALGGGEGVLRLPGGDRLPVGHLGKVFWPAGRLTKGDLLAYYAEVAPVLLPVLADRPLVMQRFPNGVHGKTFYQQRAPEDVPGGVRVESLSDDPDVPRRVVGGTLKTLLFMAQLAAISQDPWFSRVSSPRHPDYVALDLDPMPGVTFAQVLDVARWVHDELESFGIPGFPKTSGADGLHIYVPLRPGTSYESALLFSQLIATLVAQKHPAHATVTRSVGARGRTVYVDCLQNVRGKTLAAAYSARASEFAGVSTPLTWREVHRGVDRESFTIRTVPARLREVGDLWAGLRAAAGIDLQGVVNRR